MGNEPGDGETHEVTVELDGGVSKEAFDEYKRRLRECLDRLNQLTDPKNTDKPLRVRWLRGGIVRKPPR
jgi:hypothetical protein